MQGDMGLLRRLRGGPQSPPTDIAPVYVGLRDTILNLDPKTAGIDPTSDTGRAWGLVMDWSVGDAVATIVSLADGTTSLYLSTGGGSIGAGEHEAPAAASIRAVRAAEGMIDDFPTSDDAPLPGAGRTALTLLTHAGLRRIEEDNSAFERGTSRFTPVANAMQEVIHEIQLTEAASRAGSEE